MVQHSRTPIAITTSSSSSPRATPRPRLHPPGNESTVLQALDNKEAPVLTVRLANHVSSVVLVDHLGGGLAVFLHHAVDPVAYVSQVQAAFVRLAASCALELNASENAEGELTGPPAIALDLKSSRSVSYSIARQRIWLTW
jgi:hypothetical protein